MTHVLSTTLAFLAAGAGSCSGPERTELTIYAAVSLTDALEELTPDLEAHAGARIVFNLGSSGDLARQIVAGNGADLFLSADEREVERLATAGMVELGTGRAWLTNQLVVIESLDADDPGASCLPQPFTPRALAAPSIPLLALGDPDTVPAGRYARAYLQAQGLWGEIGGKILPCVDVRSALAAVESGGARAGIVYRTDAARSQRVRVAFAVPLEDGPRIAYSLAVLAERPLVARARTAAEFLSSPAARAVFERHGFVALDG